MNLIAGVYLFINALMQLSYPSVLFESKSALILNCSSLEKFKIVLVHRFRADLCENRESSENSAGLNFVKVGLMLIISTYF